jgi:large subunit ribosomal protein L32
VAVPKKKTSKARKRSRRAHWKLQPLNLVRCPQCRRLKPSHLVCPTCGHYAGRTAVAPDEA